ncbi:MAG: hypothetical protein ACJ71Y_03965 [Blastococcus sp.]|jgi:hypothetical protein
MAVSGCASTGGAGEPAAAPAPLAISEVLTSPPRDPGGLAFSVALRNDGDAPVTVTDVSAVADDGVTVEILGASTCHKGCPGAMNWRDAEPMLPDTIEFSGTFPVPPAADVQAGRADPVKVVMRVRPADAAAKRKLEGGCLFVRRLLLSVDGGEPVPARNDHADFVVALDRLDAGVPGVEPGCAEPQGS